MATLPPSGGTPPVPDDAQKAAAKLPPIFVQVLNESNVNNEQLIRRQKLIKAIEEVLTKRFGAENRLISYVLRFGHAKTMMSTSDVPSLESMLSSVSGADQINLLIHSPGGDGTFVEKIIEMCRSHLSGNNRKLRAIVPNIAKSAATVLALGTDEIMMGNVSELGPIDPQIQIVVSGATKWISAYAFIEARDNLVKEINSATKKKEPTSALLTQLATLNIPFTDEMVNLVGFSKKTAATLLDKYMLKSKYPKPAARIKKANDIAEKLLSKQLFPVHGHYIGGETAKQIGLEVEVFDKDDPLWKAIWEYYIRCEVQMNFQIAPGVVNMVKTKLFESATASIVNQDAP